MIDALSTAIPYCCACRRVSASREPAQAQPTHEHEARSTPHGVRPARVVEDADADADALTAMASTTAARSLLCCTVPCWFRRRQGEREGTEGGRGIVYHATGLGRAAGGLRAACSWRSSCSEWRFCWQICVQILGCAAAFDSLQMAPRRSRWRVSGHGHGRAWAW